MLPLGGRTVEALRTNLPPGVWQRLVKTDAFLRRYRHLIHGTAAVAVVFFAVFAYFYLHYARLIEDKLGGGGIRTNSSVYASPRLVSVGDTFTEADIIGRLQKAGYTESTDNKVGYYRRTADGLEITTGPSSYFQPHSALIHFNGSKVAKI